MAGSVAQTTRLFVERAERKSATASEMAFVGAINGGQWQCGSMKQQSHRIAEAKMPMVTVWLIATNLDS